MVLEEGPSRPGRDFQQGYVGPASVPTTAASDGSARGRGWTVGLGQGGLDLYATSLEYDRASMNT